MARDPQEHLKLKPQILRNLLELTSTAQDERNSVRFEALRKITEMINTVYSCIKTNGVEIEGLTKANSDHLKEIAELKQKISKLENNTKAFDQSLEKSHRLIRQLISVDPTIQNKIPQKEITDVLGDKPIANHAVKQYLKLYRVA